MENLNDGAAFHAIIKHESALEAMISAIIHDPSLARDALSDTMCEIVRVWASFDQTKPFVPWGCGIARRVALGTLRKRERGPCPVDPDVLTNLIEDLQEHEDESRLARYGDALRHCLGLLSIPNQDLIHFRFWDDLSYSEIGARVQRSAKALRSKMSRLLGCLGRCVAKHPL